MSNSVAWPWASAPGQDHSTASVFKPVAVKASAKPVMESLARLSAPAAQGDTVQVSKLAKALTGMAAKAYEHLDKDARTQLTQLVESGRVSADDAVKGLRSLAKSALFSRFSHEAASTPAEDEAGRKMAAMSQAFTAAANQVDTPATKARLGMKALDDQFQSGALSQEEYQTQYAAAFRDFAEKSKQEIAKGPNMEEYGTLLNSVFSSKANRFAELDFGEDDNETSASTYKIASKDEVDAAERLFKAGFNITSNAMQRFAADYDIPGLGKTDIPSWHYLKPVVR